MSSLPQLPLAGLKVPSSKPGLVSEQPAEGRFVKTDEGFMVPYTATIPGTEVQFEMLPIAGGKFKMGSPDSETGRKPAEGPQFEVEVQPFHQLGAFKWKAIKLDYKHVNTPTPTPDLVNRVVEQFRAAGCRAR